MTTKEERFNQAMNDIYFEAKEIGYTATRFFQMIHEHGGLNAAKILINSPKASAGYDKLWDMKRLDLSVEALVYENSEWHSLFTPDELEKCRNRLIEYKYLPKK